MIDTTHNPRRLDPIRRLATAGLAFSLALGVGVAANAQDTITLKMAGFLPPGHYGVHHGAQPFMDAVTAKTNGKVKFEYYPAQQLGKVTELLNLALNGVIDVAEVVPNYSSDKMPLTGVTELPGLAQTSCKATAAMRAISDPGGVLYESDLGPNGIRPIAYEVLSQYSIHSREPINSVADLEGLKLRSPGAGMDLEIKAFGGVPIQMPGPEIYDSLSRGTIDGVMHSYLGARDYNLPDVAKHGTTGYGFGTGQVIFMMSEARFSSLPLDVQTAILEAGKEVDEIFCKYMEDNEASSVQAAIDKGVSIHEFTAAEKAELDQKLASVAKDWSDKLDARGVPASKVVEEYKRLNAQN